MNFIISIRFFSLWCLMSSWHVIISFVILFPPDILSYLFRILTYNSTDCLVMTKGGKGATKEDSWLLGTCFCMTYFYFFLFSTNILRLYLSIVISYEKCQTPLNIHIIVMGFFVVIVVAVVASNIAMRIVVVKCVFYFILLCAPPRHDK